MAGPVTYSDGTTNADGEAAEARRLLERAADSVDHVAGHEAIQIVALCGIGHALLALFEQEEVRRAYGNGW